MQVTKLEVVVIGTLFGMQMVTEELAILVGGIGNTIEEKIQVVDYYGR